MQEMSRAHRWTVVGGALALGIVLSGCARKSPDDIVRQRGDQLEQLARSWWQTGEIVVVDSGDGSVRWNDALFVPASGAWEVQVQSPKSGSRRKLASLAEAAEFAGTTAEELSRWTQHLRDEDLYALQRAWGGVEIVTESGFLGGVGLLFVVSERDEELGYYLNLAKTGTAPGWHKHFRHITGRWFAWSD